MGSLRPLGAACWQQCSGRRSTISRGQGLGFEARFAQKTTQPWRERDHAAFAAPGADDGFATVDFAAFGHRDGERLGELAEIAEAQRVEGAVEGERGAPAVLVTGQRFTERGFERARV